MGILLGWAGLRQIEYLRSPSRWTFELALVAEDLFQRQCILWTKRHPRRWSPSRTMALRHRAKVYAANLGLRVLNIPPVLVCVASHFRRLARFKRDSTASPLSSRAESAPVEGRDSHFLPESLRGLGRAAAFRMRDEGSALVGHVAA
jgi:hypothetical protein